MIYGIGTDIINIQRIERIYAKFGTCFLTKFLHPNEINNFNTKFKDKNANKGATHFLAKRFAAKEAFVKALGIGVRQGIRFQDFGVSHNALGKPSFEFTGKIKHIILEQELKVNLSVSDEAHYAVAFVVIVKV